MKILIGADPEVFVRDEKGRFRSAHGLIPGTKEEPYPVQDGAVQVDGLALEFNTTPAATREEFIHHIGSVMNQLAGMVPGYTLAIEPTARFHHMHLKTQPEKALELGCEPDYCAYTGQQNPRPNAATTMRTAAGHVHIGGFETDDPTGEEHMTKCITLVKVLDAFLGLNSLFWDHDNKRRAMYGKAGAFRPKPYGVEYRSLSNAWLKHPDLVGKVFDQSKKAVELLLSGKRVSKEQQLNIRRYIDNGLTFSHAKGKSGNYMSDTRWAYEPLARAIGIEVPPNPFIL
jgi:hypothetical protein